MGLALFVAGDGRLLLVGPALGVLMALGGLVARPRVPPRIPVTGRRARVVGVRDLGPVIHAPKRLRTMAILATSDEVTFALLQERLELKPPDRQDRFGTGWDRPGEDSRGARGGRRGGHR